MEKKFKTQVLTVSKRFLSGHPKAGEMTCFREKIIEKLGEYYPVQCKCGWVGSSEHCDSFPIGDTGDHSDPTCPICESDVFDFKCEPKIHTIRDNYSYWESAIERNMLLSIRQWIDKPYKKPGQEKIVDLEPGEWGIQGITMINGHNGLEAFVGDKNIDIDVLAENDGLSRTDFEAWFAPRFKRKDIFDGVVIHFTDFRY